ncbi:MAG: tetratricopeptide repeat protein [Candidatus Eremiobacteraeota bacterium]|nr:tetratricopeptide repeat protein [Candidatus Eremiobacteraeota bacterium]
MRKLLIALMMSLVCLAPVLADEQGQVEMLKEVFKAPIPQWKEIMGRHRGVLDNAFFDKVERRIRWAIDNNHIDDAFRFAILGDLGRDVAGKEGSYRLDLAWAFFKSGNFQMTQELVDNILITHPDTLQALYLKGRLQEQFKQLYEAHQTYEIVARRNYEKADCLHRMALISFILGEDKRGVEEAQEAIKNGSTEAKAVLDAYNRRMSGGIVPPEPQPGTASSGNADVNALIQEAELQIAANKFNAAEALLRKAIQTDPRNLAAHVSIGALFYRMGDIDSAIEYLDRATQLDGGSLEAWRYLGNSYERRYDVKADKGDLDKAKAAYLKAAALAPADPLVQIEVARIKSKN